MEVIPDFTQKTMTAFACANIESGTTIITDKMRPASCIGPRNRARSLGEDETLFDRRRVERVDANALPLEWHPRQSSGDGERVPDPDEAPVRFAKALGDRHVVGRQMPKPVEISAVRIRPTDVETAAVGAHECPGDGRGPVGAARDEECRADRDAGRKPKPSHAGTSIRGDWLPQRLRRVGNGQESSGRSLAGGRCLTLHLVAC